MKNIKMTEQEKTTIFFEPVKCPIENEWCHAFHGDNRCDDCPLCDSLRNAKE